MAAINSVLEARNPALQLLGRSVPLNHGEQEVENESAADARTDEEDALEYVSLKAGATITINPLDRSVQGNPATFELKRDSTFRVIGELDSRDQWDILVPTYGHCSVPRGPDTKLDKTVEAPAASSLVEGYKGNITKLEMKFMVMNDGHALVPLITYLAPRLEHLELSLSL
ncbi:hypothetical protein FI667_g6013, partial [Globisporangium splendens]